MTSGWAPTATGTGWLVALVTKVQNIVPDILVTSSCPYQSSILSSTRQSTGCSKSHASTVTDSECLTMSRPSSLSNSASLMLVL